MEVKPGYKQTEVGVIPEEWEVSALESVARIIDPQPDHRTPPEAPAGEPYIGISDFIDDRTVNWDASRKIVSRAVDKQQSSFRIRSGDIIFGKIGTIGSPKFLPAAPFRFGLSANVLLIQPAIEPYFVMSWLCSKTCERAITGELHSTSQAAFGINKMRRVMIPLPHESEQRAIAGVLSDVDELIDALDQLIAKKRDLKQAAMQQLLTGQTRLPGFSGEWEVKRLGTLLRFQVGFPFSSAFFNEKGEGVRLVKNRDLKSDDQIFHYSGKFDDTYVVRDGDVLVGMDGDFMPCVWRKEFSLLNQRVGRIVPNAGLHGAFAYYRLIELLKKIEFVTSSTTVKHLSHGDIEDIECPMPEFVQQTAIAEVLTDMDAELAALEQRRDKTRVLKQGMMQELLTGKTRLVESEKLKVES